MTQLWACVPATGMPNVFPARTFDVPQQPPTYAARDRKSTRLNSSHSQISYAVFCLKKKNVTDDHSELCVFVVDYLPVRHFAVGVPPASEISRLVLLSARHLDDDDLPITLEFLGCHS